MGERPNPPGRRQGLSDCVYAEMVKRPGVETTGYDILDEVESHFPGIEAPRITVVLSIMTGPPSKRSAAERYPGIHKGSVRGSYVYRPGTMAPPGQPRQPRSTGEPVYRRRYECRGEDIAQGDIVETHPGQWVEALTVIDNGPWLCLVMSHTKSCLSVRKGDRFAVLRPDDPERVRT